MNASPEVSTDVDLKPGQILRRYLDLYKYLALLCSRELYFNRADRFSDRFEGALTPAFRKARNEAHRQKLVDTDADHFYRRSRIGNYANCWSLGAHDNMALWQLYGASQNAVVITTTVDKLVKTALEWNEQILIHKVQYIDHFKNPDMIVGRYTDFLRFKHKAYRYEAELRMIVPRQHSQWENNPSAIRLPVRNLNTLFRSVVVSPEAELSFYNLIKDVSQKYGITKPIRRSKLTWLPK
jgi:hypothetical protein